VKRAIANATASKSIPIIAQSSSTDGETWEENREDDPRFNPPTLPPLPIEPGDNLRCAAANNVTGYLQSAADQIIADSAAWGNLSALLGVLMSVILVIIAGASLGTLSPLALGLIGALMATGSSAFTAAMTAGVYETFLCIVYCHTPEDGVYTESDWQAIKGQTITDITGIAGTFFSENLNIMGVAGMNNASRTGINAGIDCESCDCDSLWCYLFDFNATMAQQGWTAWVRPTGGGGTSATTWTGSGWQSAPTGGAFPFNDDIQASIKRAFTDSFVTSVTINWSGGNSALNYGCRVQVLKTDNTTQEFNSNGVGMFTKVQAINLGVKEIRVSIEQSGTQSGYPPAIIIDDVTFNGEGTNPIGVNNCP